MTNPIRIRRRAAGGASGAPSSLLNAELAFNEQDLTLYYGLGTGGAGGSATSVIAIGGAGAFVSQSALLATRLDQFSAPTASVSFNSQKITNLADPTSAQDAATKNYVDLAVQGLDAKQSVKAATTTNITLSGTQTIDGVALVAGDRVLVKNQTVPAQNGIYVVAAGSWSRATDMDTWAEVPNAFVFVEQGTTLADTSWVASPDQGGTLGTTSIAWFQFGSAAAYTAGNGLQLSGNSFSVLADGSSLSVSASGVRISASYVGQTSITTLGTITTGTWNGSTIGVGYGGLGLTSAVTGLLKGNGTSYSAAVAGTDYLDSTSTIDGGTF